MVTVKIGGGYGDKSVKKIAREYKSKLRQSRREAIQAQTSQGNKVTSSLVVELRKSAREYKKKLRGI